MLTIDEMNNISITQGDNFTLPLLAYKDENKIESYILAEGERFILSVRAIAGSEPVITKETATQDSEGGFSFDFSPEETAGLKRAEYVYDVALANESGTLRNTFLGGEEEKRLFRVV